MFGRTIKYGLSFYALFLNISTVMATEIKGETYQDKVLPLIFNFGESNSVVNSEFQGNWASGRANYMGGAIFNEGEISQIEESVFKNNAARTGGAISNYEGYIDKISNTTFDGNRAAYMYDVYGGAIANMHTIVGPAVMPVDVDGEEPGDDEDDDVEVKRGIGEISHSTFTNNKVVEVDGGGRYFADGFGGGAIYNETNIGVISDSEFNGNSVEAVNRAGGGAIANGSSWWRGETATIDSIEDTTFSNNKVVSEYSDAFGGAIANEIRGTINSVSDVRFENNIAQGTSAYGGAIYNNGQNAQAEDMSLMAKARVDGIGTLQNVTFEKNQAIADSKMYEEMMPLAYGYAEALGGAIYNNGQIDSIQGNKFIENVVTAGSDALGGAIFNQYDLGEIVDTSFVKNQALSDEGNAYGGAIFNNGNIGQISADFSGNSVVGKYAAGGGAIMQTNMYDELRLVNSNFHDNFVEAQEGEAFGGAVYADKLSVVADGANSEFKGNMANGVSNALQIGYWGGEEGNAIDDEEGEDAGDDYEDSFNYLNIEAKNGGNVLIYDGVAGEHYDLNIKGDGTGEVLFDNHVDGVENMRLASGAVVHLGKNAEINTVDYTSNGAIMKLDIAVDAENEKIQNGMLNVSGNVNGNTKVIVNSENPSTFEGAKTMFVNAENFNDGKAEQFEVARVVGSPYMWKSIVNAGGEETGSYWYVSLTDEENPDYTQPDEEKPNEPTEEKPSEPQPTYAPEVANYVGIQSAAVEQNRSIADSVARGLSDKKSTKCYGKSCGIAGIIPHKKVWIDVSLENAELKSPVDMDANIKGTSIGLDLYANGVHRAGAFGSYRHGKYDVSGKGDYYSYLASDIKTDSYLGGLYYQYNKNDWQMLGTAFIGKQDMDISTDDHIAFASTDALQLGVSAEVAKRIAISNYLDLEPSLGLRYTVLDIDTLHDNVGKTAAFDTVQYLEAELGLKLEHIFCNKACTNRIYVKPSVIQTFVKGGKTRITGISEEVKSLKQQTLGRVEVGGMFGISSKLSGYVNTGYTIGDDYEAYDVNLGVNYRF